MELNSKSTHIPHSYNLDPVYRFFCWCSGARLYLLRSCPTDYNKFFGIGIIVFLTGIMASLTGFYALLLIFDSQLAALIFGLFWGILIFFLDWYIVASLKKEERIGSELLFATPRLILAVLLSIVISRPLELKLFEKEIDAALQNIHATKSIEYNQLVDNEYNNLNVLIADNNNMAIEIKQKEELRNKLFNIVIEEAEGRSPTAKIGKGIVYKEKKAEYDKIDFELKQLKESYEQRIKKNLEQISLIEKSKLEQTKKSRDQINRSDGLLARMEALSLLSQNNQTIKFTGWFIFLLFLLIESSPILVKLLSHRGPYDELVEKEEFEKQIEYKKQKIKAKILANNYLELLKQKDELEFESEKRNNEKLYNEIEIAKDEINSLAVGKWKQKEIDAITRAVEKSMGEVQVQEEKPDIIEEVNSKIEENEINEEDLPLKQ